ncbi:unnamed protein product [Ectocarpus sp. CCAP 1310/34]|nr:unnamed protein product [Ectocarpus sp. CCAP 1310/34]
MSAEFEGLFRAGTFALAVKAPIGYNVIDARWVYKWKADETGKIVKAKVRLGAKGFKQKHGVDYRETFSPTAIAASIRLLVALACKYNLEFLHFDIEQAFVQSELDQEERSSVSTRVYLYGPRQASRTFHKRLVSDLKTTGFEQSLSDPCVLLFIMGDEVMGMVATNVDDILYAGIERLAEMVVEALGDSLSTKNLGEERSSVSTRVYLYGPRQASRTFHKRLVSDLKTTGFEQSLSDPCVLLFIMGDEVMGMVATNVDDILYAGIERLAEMVVEALGDVPFREVVGSLIWIANKTRPDISNAVRAVARHSHEPKKIHWKAAQKILNYLLETAHQTLKYKQDDTQCVSLSTSEAEYIMMGDGVMEALFVNGMLEFLRPCEKLGKIQVLEDNEGAIALAEKLV